MALVERERADRVVSVDAGIWLAFLRNESSAEPLRKLLQEERVSVHPFVLMELRLEVRGPQRARILGDLERLVACAVDPPEVVSAFIEERDLAASRIDVVILLMSADPTATNCVDHRNFFRAAYGFN